jgi:hypothetical protein
MPRTKTKPEAGTFSVQVPYKQVSRATWKTLTWHLFPQAQADLLIRMANTFSDPKGCEPSDRAALDLAETRLHDKENLIEFKS